MKGGGKRAAASPMKNAGKAQKAQKALSFSSEEAYDDTGMDNSHDSGGAPRPPQWFIEFEHRQDQRFNKVFDECKELFEGLKIEFEQRLSEMTEKAKALDTRVKLAEQKLDDLENRSRRCNIVIFNLPEGEEGQDCFGFISGLIHKECDLKPTIQRAHRTGVRKGDKPRPIHVALAFFQEKEACKRALSEVFKKKKFGGSKLFVSNDFSQRVQQMRRDKMPEVRKLREEGKQAFLVYPATIKIRDSLGNIRNP